MLNEKCNSNKVIYFIRKNKSKRFFLFSFLFLLFFSFSAQNKPDSTLLKTDTLALDTNAAKGALEFKVEYYAEDSMVFDIKKQLMYLYGKSKIDYETTSLTAANVEMFLKDKELFARGTKDSTGKYVDNPFFKEGEQGFNSDSIHYNFGSEKGKIYRAKTQDGDGYIHGSELKKVDDKVIYIKDGKYTTCEHDTPHFYIEAKKLKLIKEDKIITGPANLKVYGAPTPLLLPFGFFPNKKERTSGIVMPNNYGVSPGQGIFLNRMGYYWAVNQHVTTELLADLYSRGSWALYLNNNYKFRYKNSGNLGIDYSIFKQGFKELPDYSQTKNMFVRWSHQQEAQANPNWNFSAQVNAGTASAYRNNINTTTQNFTSNNFNSNVSLTHNFKIAKTFSSLIVNAQHSQNVLDSSITINAPNVTLNVTRFAPFKRKKSVTERWYEKIGMSYNAGFQNQISTKLDSNFFTKKTLEKMNYGLQHSVGLNTSFKLLKYFSLVPSINYKGVAYFQSYRKRWDIENQREKIDTLDAFNIFHTVSSNAQVTTKIYGTYGFKSDSKIKAIRHVLTPSIGVTYSPNLNKIDALNYFSAYTIYDTNQREVRKQTYSILNGVYGSPNESQIGNITFALINDVEMKYTGNDSLKTEKKLKILDNVNVSSAYSVLADSLKWQPLNFRGNVNLVKNLLINFSGDLDPYQIDFKTRNRINKFVWDTDDWWTNGRSIGRLTRFDVSLGYTLRSKTDLPTQNKTSTKGTPEELAQINANPQQYVDFNLPWSLTMSYNFFYTKPNSNPYNPEITSTFNINADVRLTPAWKIIFNTSYDLKKYKFALPRVEIYRDLHCWEMKFQVIPSGSRQSYSFTMNAKASILQDLKLNRRLEWYDR